ncbi:cell division protein [Thermanaerovibrio velox DSM 12556]|uniref:Cell division protein FtsX n=1 Tax=Thermanaerovibrio velox DSM 12556 TaxID=926567 RepID=H0UNM3_9BACT|nr:permease-like cell division protein FtsX [Thermanaerovibrio velox]EHM10438.1 cell division protein [Thermanaerovibrio velox DSM 12556]
MGSFRYAIRDGLRLVFRHWGLSFLTLFTSAAVFYLMGSSILFVLNTRHVVKNLEGELSIQAYVSPNVDLNGFAARVRRMPHVRAVEVITPAKALERLKARLGSQAQAITLLGENPLPPSVEVWVDKASSVPIVARELVAVDEVQDVVYAGKLAEKLAKLSRFAGRFSLAVLLVAVAASGVVLFNTIRIAVYSKEEEIAIMLMVGATPSFVAMPFIIQGVLLGSLGAFCSSVMLAFSYGAAVERLKDFLPFLELLNDSSLLVRLGGVLVGGGALVSFFASFLAVERFIRRALKPL